MYKENINKLKENVVAILIEKKYTSVNYYNISLWDGRIK